MAPRRLALAVCGGAAAIAFIVWAVAGYHGSATAVVLTALIVQSAALGVLGAAVAQILRGQRRLAYTHERMRQSIRAISAAPWLDRVLRPERALPAFGGWALEADSIAHVVAQIRDEAPKCIVELGSGASTVCIALALQRFDLKSRFVSIDHEATYMAETRRALLRQGVAERVELVCAPLEPLELDGRIFRWYSAGAVRELGLENVDLLLVDGPPKSSGPLARYPALAMFRPYLSTAAAIVLDDADRDDELEMMAGWASNLGVRVELIRTARPMASLRLGDAAAGLEGARPVAAAEGA